MSDAKVQFHELDNLEHRWRDRRPMEGGKEQTFSFACPKHNRRCGDMVIAGRTIFKRGSGGVPQWEWDGNVEWPTFTPSINCKGCWHGFIRAGRCVDVNGKDEP
jgi:hypothetical protein